MTDKTDTAATAEKDQKIAAAKQHLRESGMPAAVVDALPEEMLTEVAEHKGPVKVINLAAVLDALAEGKCGHPRLQITDHPDAPREASESVRGNIELILIMLCGWLADDPESYRKFRRYAMRKAARAQAELLEQNPDCDDDSVALFREMEPEFFRDLMHWFR